MHVNVNVHVNNFLAISKSDFDNSGEPGPQADVRGYRTSPAQQVIACPGVAVRRRTKTNGATRQTHYNDGNTTLEVPPHAICVALGSSSLILDVLHWGTSRLLIRVSAVRLLPFTLL